MRFRVVESFAKRLAQSISWHYDDTPMHQMIEEARERGVRPQDVFSSTTHLVDPVEFFEQLTEGTDERYKRNAFVRIFQNSKNQSFYRTLLGYLDSLGTKNYNYPKIEPASTQRGRPLDGRHRAALCILLGIGLPVEEI